MIVLQMAPLPRMCQPSKMQPEWQMPPGHHYPHWSNLAPVVRSSHLILPFALSQLSFDSPHLLNVSFLSLFCLP